MKSYNSHMPITVSPDRLRQSAATLRSGGASISTELRRLLGDVRELRATWDGRAALSFDAHYQRADQGFRQVEQALEAIAGLLSTTAAQYEHHDADLARRFL